MIMLALTLLLLSTGCALRGKDASAALFAMDTYCTIEAHGDNAALAVEAARTELLRLEALFSISEPESDVSRINASDGAPLEVSTDTAALLAAASAVSTETDGAFDVTVEPLVRLWGFYDDAQRVPAESEIRKSLSRVDYRRLLLNGRTVQKGADQSVDLGGVAKGYASDRMAAVLAANGVDGALISLGGNVHALGVRPGGGAWRVGVQDPADESAVLGIVEARDCAIVTAGVYQRFFEREGVRYHHIIDPADGRPADAGLISVTVIGSYGARADALSTALLVMGEEAAIAFWRSGGHSFDMLLVTEDGRLLYTGTAFTPHTSAYRFAKIVE